MWVMHGWLYQTIAWDTMIVFLNFDIQFVQNLQLVCQTIKSVRPNFLSKYVNEDFYLSKILTFLEKYMRWSCGSQMDL